MAIIKRLITTITTDVDENNNIINTHTVVQQLDLKQWVNGCMEVKVRQQVLDICTIIEGAMKCPDNMNLEEATKWIRKESIHRMKLIACDRKIEYSTVLSNVVRRFIIAKSNDLYEGLARYIVNKDMSIVNELLDKTRNTDEDEYILTSFEGVKKTNTI